MTLVETPFVSAEEINALCSYEKIIENQRQVFKNYFLDQAVMGPRAILSQNENAQFSYIARASTNGPTIVKFGTVVPSNAGRDIPVVQTTVSVIDATTGGVKLFLDGEAVTKWRTVCASMAAAKELSNPVKSVAVIGVGHQGMAHLQAAKHIFKPERVIGIDQYIKNNDLGFEITQNIQAAYDAKTISEQSGSVVKTLENSERTWQQAQSIGGVYAGEIKGRENKEQVIYYFSVGLGIQDAALAEFILTNGKF